MRSEQFLRNNMECGMRETEINSKRDQKYSWGLNKSALPNADQSNKVIM